MAKPDRKRPPKTAASARLPILPCGCANLRRAARAISQLYDDALRDAGLSIAQFTLLQALALAGEPTQGRLGKILALDGTTLTRTLRTIERRGWIRRAEGEDRRSRIVALTSAGRAAFERAVPAWNRAQRVLRGRVGRRRWNGLMKELSRIAGTAPRS
jgi:DNA-binding MarR family transcriptional regulator